MKNPLAKYERRDYRDALRLALQAAVAGAALYVLMQVLGLPEKFVGVLSAVFVVQPSVGSAMTTGWNRFLSTLVGSGVAVLCLMAMPDGWSAAVALAVTMFVIHAVAGLKPDWRYGVVAAVAISISTGEKPMETALDRCIAIGLGVAVGFLTSLVVWPERASTRAARDVDSALLAVVQWNRAVLSRVSGRSRDDGRDGEEDGDGRDADEAGQEALSRYHSKMESARSAAGSMRVGKGGHLWGRIEAIERVYHAMVMMERSIESVREHAAAGEGVARALERMRGLTGEIAEALADGERGQQEKIDALGEAIESARSAVNESRGDSEHREQRRLDALLFAADELRLDFERLDGSYNERAGLKAGW